MMISRIVIIFSRSDDDGPPAGSRRNARLQQPVTRTASACAPTQTGCGYRETETTIISVSAPFEPVRALLYNRVCTCVSPSVVALCWRTTTAFFRGDHWNARNRLSARFRRNENVGIQRTYWGLEQVVPPRPDRTLRVITTGRRRVSD